MTMPDPFKGEDPEVWAAAQQWWFDEYADRIGQPHRPALDWDRDAWAARERAIADWRERVAAFAEVSESLRTVASVQELLGIVPPDAPVAASLEAGDHDRLVAALDAVIRAEHGNAYEYARRGWFTDDAKLTGVLNALVQWVDRDSGPADGCRQLLHAIRGEWMDLLAAGSPNDLEYQAEPDPDDLETLYDQRQGETRYINRPGEVRADELGRARGLVAVAEPLNICPPVLREAVAVTVARLPYAATDAYEVWLEAVRSVFGSLQFKQTP